MKDIVEKRRKYGLLTVVFGRVKYGTIIGNNAVEWTNLEDPGGYNETVQVQDLSFDRSKGGINTPERW